MFVAGKALNLGVPGVDRQRSHGSGRFTAQGDAGILRSLIMCQLNEGAMRAFLVLELTIQRNGAGEITLATQNQAGGRFMGGVGVPENLAGAVQGIDIPDSAPGAFIQRDAGIIIHLQLADIALHIRGLAIGIELHIILQAQRTQHIHAGTGSKMKFLSADRKRCVLAAIGTAGKLDGATSSLHIQLRTAAQVNITTEGGGAVISNGKRGRTSAILHADIGFYRTGLQIQAGTAGQINAAVARGAETILQHQRTGIHIQGTESMTAGQVESVCAALVYSCQIKRQAVIKITIQCHEIK